MPPKPHRVLLDRVSGYADEAAAYMRRRKIARRPFARLYYANGRATDQDIDGKAGIALFDAADRLVEVAGNPRRRRV
jgi:hypothetical protein